MQKQRGYTLLELMVSGWVIVAFLGIVGYVGNVVQLIHQALDPLTVLVILKLVGLVIPPLGALMGWIGFFA